MPETKIDSAVVSNLKNVQETFEVGSKTTEGPTGQKEREFMDTTFNQWFGYYTSDKVPEITALIDAKSTWTMGKGIKADEVTTMLLDTIKGNGKDTFNTILENAIRTMLIGGNFYAEIVRDDEGNFINLKTLDPGSIKIIVNEKGMIQRFEQINKTDKKTIHKFNPEEMFYLARNKTADEVLGRGILVKLKRILDMKNEAMDDNRLINHRFAYPRWILHLDTDDDTEITKFKAKYDKANADGENMYIPKDLVVPELVAVAPNATINLLPWINYLDNLLYQTAGVPKIIVGGSSEFTEKASSIVYLAFQQSVEEDQLYIEEQVLSQLNLVIELEFPVSLENELLTDQKKDQAPTTVQPNETTAGAGQ